MGIFVLSSCDSFCEIFLRLGRWSQRARGTRTEIILSVVGLPWCSSSSCRAPAFQRPRPVERRASGPKQDLTWPDLTDKQACFTYCSFGSSIRGSSCCVLSLGVSNIRIIGSVTKSQTRTRVAEHIVGVYLHSGTNRPICPLSPTGAIAVRCCSTQNFDGNCSAQALRSTLQLKPNAHWSGGVLCWLCHWQLLSCLRISSVWTRALFFCDLPVITCGVLEFVPPEFLFSAPSPQSSQSAPLKRYANPTSLGVAPFFALLVSVFPWFVYSVLGGHLRPQHVNHMRQRDKIFMIIIFVGFAYELVLTGHSLYITCFETFLQHLFGYVHQLVTQASIRCSSPVCITTTMLRS